MSWRIDLKFIEPGKNTDGYWKSEDMILHVFFFFEKKRRNIKKVIPIFEQLHPNCIGLFTFDQSTNHSAIPEEDAFITSKMNLRPGGKLPKM